jgi:hypothetical protein
MQDKFRLYRRPNGMLYAEEYGTRHRESLQTKNEAEARRLIAAKNQAASQPVFNMEMAKVYLRLTTRVMCRNRRQGVHFELAAGALGYRTSTGMVLSLRKTLPSRRKGHHRYR